MRTSNTHHYGHFGLLALLALAGSSPVSAAESEYVGSGICKTCHQSEFDAWQGSHHDLAMQHATPDTVQGDFNDAEVTIHGETSRFFIRDGKFFVYTDGPDSKMADFEVAYTFGVEPLQQYLVKFPDGRVQALGLAWDSRPESQGGQRWFHLYPDEPIAAGDELHWTGRQQNWNYMCADCHSTNLVKGYDVESNRFDTTWSEIDVSCEACHGPGRNHVAWAGQGEVLRQADLAFGLDLLLRDRKDSSWFMNLDTGIANRSKSPKSPSEVDICADCHSRRGTISGGGQADRTFLDQHMPALITEGLYYPDGQIQDEVFVWGSFTQSKMFQAGVTCSDCHEPHSLKLRAEGDTVCAQCHLPTKFAVAEHHGHGQTQNPPACVDCHMPEATYMVVDPRRDHRMGIPRPDLSQAIGSPNACSQCHGDKSAEWVVASFNTMFPNAASLYQSWGTAFSQARQGLPQAEISLVRIAADTGKPDIARATAVLELSDFLSPLSGELLQEALKDASPLVRLASLRTLEMLRPEHRFDFAKHLLGDESLAIRSEAGRVLAATPPEQLVGSEGLALSGALNDYINTQMYNADRPESWLNLGNLRSRMGNLQQAELDYRQAVKLAPDFAAGYLNLADLFRAQGREDQALETLKRGLERQPADAALHHALGLALVRQGNTPEGLVELKRAIELSPEQPRYAYVYAVGLNSSGQAREAITVLEQANKTHPTDMQIMQSLVLFERDRGKPDRARYWVEKMLEVNPADQAARQLQQSLNSGQP